MEAFQAKVNVTYAGQNADLTDPVPFDATDAEVLGWVRESLVGGIPGLVPVANPDLEGFVVERFNATAERPFNLIGIRPKTAFGC